MDKKELDEIKKWEFEQKQNDIDRFGVDISQFKVKNRKKKSRKAVNLMARLGTLFKTSMVIIFILATIIVLASISIYFSAINERADVNIDNYFKMYGIKVKVLNQETSGRIDNGKYYLQRTTEPKIKFTAIKHYGSLNNDYLDQIIKYYFDLWNSDDKKYFTVNESVEDGLLNYELFLADYPSIEIAAEAFVNFAQFCGNEFKGYWDVYIIVGNSRIYPYTSSNTTHEKAIKNIIDIYNMHQQFGNIMGDNEPIPTTT